MGREPEFDRRMIRTSSRPVVKGIISPQQAFRFAAMTGSIGSAILYFGVNPVVAALGLSNIVLYGWCYTSLKRKSILNTWVGAIVGAIPPLMGWAASSSLLHPGAWCLASLLYAWQFPHFNALSHNIAAQYKQAGYIMTAAENPRLNARKHKVELAQVIEKFIGLKSGPTGDYLPSAVTHVMTQDQEFLPIHQTNSTDDAEDEEYIPGETESDTDNEDDEMSDAEQTLDKAELREDAVYLRDAASDSESSELDVDESYPYDRLTNKKPRRDLSSDPPTDAPILGYDLDAKLPSHQTGLETPSSTPSSSQQGETPTDEGETTLTTTGPTGLPSSPEPSTAALAPVLAPDDFKFGFDMKKVDATPLPDTPPAATKPSEPPSRRNPTRGTTRGLMAGHYKDLHTGKPRGKTLSTPSTIPPLSDSSDQLAIIKGRNDTDTENESDSHSQSETSSESQELESTNSSGTPALTILNLKRKFSKITRLVVATDPEYSNHLRPDTLQRCLRVRNVSNRLIDNTHSKLLDSKLKTLQDNVVIDTEETLHAAETDNDTTYPYNYKQAMRTAERIDFEETYAPVIKYASVRLFVAIAAAKTLSIHQMDVKTAFLNGELKEEIYMEQPEGFKDPRFPNHVLKLHKAVYGLKQAPLVWNENINKFLQTLGFTRSELEPCLYFIHKNGKLTLLGLYVDDILLLSEDPKTIKDVKAAIFKKYKVKDMGIAKKYLNIDLCYELTGIVMNLKSYIGKMLDKFGLNSIKPKGLPLSQELERFLAPTVEDRHSVDLENEPDAKDPARYRQMIGTFVHASNTVRADIAYVTSLLAKYLKNPKERHMKIAMNVFAYLKGTINLGLHYKFKTQPQVHCHVDASWRTANAQSARVYFFNGAPILWSSKKQTTVATSTQVAELTAIYSAVFEAEWLKELTKELKFQQETITIWNDNSAALSVIRGTGSISPLHYNRTVDRHLSYVRQAVHAKIVEVLYIKSALNHADPLTKALSEVLIKKHLEGLGMKLSTQKS
ncbi:protoheme IX farnesyltransferase, mitochondrial [Candidozyma pseudohaemuli]|uniref:Heme O synthase n=1 Tax=Candidozyma pseudohaemuli TaxID=418784 RepID=A0A2P7YM44_9ASCO|nr:protoheme IX farnesyltransferase, mitochondrial [[Candida] pseudohaemulonii]PSK37034.1 protoheme IX farnesyltransferase, mitochondrial [[Candida] pseudohaemulonii]